MTVSLMEGGVARHTQRLVSDRGGIVMARVPIPRVDEPVWEWKLRAEAETTATGIAELTLTPREETPGMPTLLASWEAPASGVLAGDRVPFAIRVHDATGQPIVDQGVRYWIGPKGTTPPANDDEWEKHGTIAKTDGAGTVHGTRDMPTLVKSRGSAMQLVVTTLAFGHPLTAARDVAIGVSSATADLTPEASSIVPGLSQRMLFRVRDARGTGVAATFIANGDGLRATFTTDASGEGEIVWNVPRGVGATRSVGPCAGGVAAAVLNPPEHQGGRPGESTRRLCALRAGRSGCRRHRPGRARRRAPGRWRGMSPCTTLSTNRSPPGAVAPQRRPCLEQTSPGGRRVARAESGRNGDGRESSFRPMPAVGAGRSPPCSRRRHAGRAWSGRRSWSSRRRRRCSQPSASAAVRRRVAPSTSRRSSPTGMAMASPGRSRRSSSMPSAAATST